MTTTSPNCIRVGLLSVVMFFSGVCITILNILYSLLSLDGNFQKKISEDEVYLERLSNIDRKRWLC